MRKSIVLTSILSILSISAFADITGSSSCTEGVLGTSANGSTANVDANWSQNRININWYNGDTKVSESYCMYDDTITLPTQPTKPGYTFAGWTLRTSCSSGTYLINSQCLTLAQAVASCATGTYFNGVSCVACDSMLNGTCIIGTTASWRGDNGCIKFQTQEMCEYAASNWGSSTTWSGSDSNPSGYGVYISASECYWSGNSCMTNDSGG